MHAKFHRLLSFILLMCTAAGLLCTTASAEISLPDSTQPYVFTYSGSSTQESSYKFDFRWVYPSGRSENWRGKNYSLRIFQLDRTDGQSETASAYCCDFIMSAVVDSAYRRMNLEDSTYFSDASAAHIRGIFSKGYWHDWTASDLAAAESAANDWLVAYESGSASYDGASAPLPPDAEDKVVQWAEDENGETSAVPPISGLTADQALAATQLAIWAFANTEGDGYWVDFRDSNGTADSGDDYEFHQNILAFRKYLLHQTAEAQSPDTLLFSDEHFTSVKSAITTGGTAGENAAEFSYEVTLFFSLKGNVDDDDELTVSAALGSMEPVVIPLKDLPSDKNGYRTITFSSVSPEDAKNGIELTLSGEQKTDGVYFYQAKPSDTEDGREASQNLVGWACGMTPVRAVTHVDIALGEKSAVVKKYDSSSPSEHSSEDSVEISGSFYPLLPGAEFDLCVKQNEGYVTVREGLVTDESGLLRLDALPDGYDYYLRETRAPIGYVLGGEYIPIVFPGSSQEPGEAFIGNCHLLGELTVGKTVKGISTDQHFSFRITLDLSTATLYRAAKLMPTQLTAAWQGAESCDAALHAQAVDFSRDGDRLTANVQLRHGETLTLCGIPVGVSYTVTETDSGIYSVSPESISGTISSEPSNAAFVNSAYPQEDAIIYPQPARWQPNALKTLDGTPSQGHTICLTPPRGDELTAVSNSSGVARFPVQFFYFPGSYSYTFREVPGEREDILYDSSVYTVTVTVTAPVFDYEVTDITVAKNGVETDLDLPVFENATLTQDEQPQETPAATPSPTPDVTPAPTTPAPDVTPAPAATPTPESAGNPAPSVSPDATGSDHGVPRTGDPSSPWPLLGLISALCLGATFLRKKA